MEGCSIAPIPDLLMKHGDIEFVLRCGAADLDAAGHLVAPTTAIANAQPSRGPRQ